VTDTTPDDPRSAGADFQNSKPVACLPEAQNLKFEREDWTSFRTIEGLQQKAGVPKDALARLVLKELADNALDTGAKVRVGKIKGGYFVEDDGPGIGGTPEEIARLFSVRRPMVSTKLLRLPTRGALGNGLRVVAGAVLASSGSLSIVTRNQRIGLRPERDGSTTVISVEPVDHPIGTRVEIGFGPSLPADEDPLFWARTAIVLADGGSSYVGRSSPWWYDIPHFHELLSACGERPVRELIAQLDGCTGGKAGEIVASAGLNRATCARVTRPQAERLLRVAQEQVRSVNPKRLGSIGPQQYPRAAYACAYATAKSGAEKTKAQIPFVVEAWAQPDSDDTRLITSVNRTPVAGKIYATRNKHDINVFGCGIGHTVATAPRRALYYRAQHHHAIHAHHFGRQGA
jgi:hypothetical protein